jgi:hypothetical protein
MIWTHKCITTCINGCNFYGWNGTMNVSLEWTNSMKIDFKVVMEMCDQIIEKVFEKSRIFNLISFWEHWW